MTLSILKPKFLFFLFLVIGCKGLSPAEKSCGNFVRGFSYRHYIGKSFGEFYRDFKTKADSNGMETNCGLYHPKAGMIGGTELQLDEGYKIAVLNNSEYYAPNYLDTVPLCFECSCIQNDTAKITGFILSQNQHVIRIY